MPPNLDRRIVLVGASSVALLGPARAEAGAIVHPDQDLIARCEEAMTLDQDWITGVCDSDDLPGPDHDMAMERLHPILIRRDSLSDQVCASTPRTKRGAQAMAQLALQLADGGIPQDSERDRVAWALVQVVANPAYLNT